ncbi:type II toxin-antitoxin system RelB/DinJ family antitoxin [Secundilactobacillus kimchicus]|uniref:type II toxin-antitoxin system RelB/DinJ family antitoxin n=1 Tax=Secundilactobacillus kimchicus TaxID=528209 RepID=UPI001C021D3D|nr:type II toxin-antitoxin system RelB/DinJ family antitoxin [Secundilactobacillus kimchicus]MBT9670486.1 type II toxin-antitoxin system RelB/DinJ family antitoxin [Secundilactobacillus kimchicus]
MPTKQERVQVKMDADLKRQTEQVMESLGISQTALITMLYRRVVAEQRIPFSLELTPEESLKNHVTDYVKTIPVTKVNSTQELIEAIEKDEAAQENEEL